MDSAIEAIKEMVLYDPIIKELYNGRMKWGNIPGILDTITNTCELDNSSVLTYEIPSKVLDEEPLVIHSNVPEIKTIIIRNLPRDITVNELRSIFETFGPIRDIYIPKNMEKTSPLFGTIKGFALIKFLNHISSYRAFKELAGSLIIRGNITSIEFAKQDR